MKLLTKQCTACRACENICPVQSIQLISDEYNVERAFIQEDTCIECGLCKKKCPVLSPLKLHDPITVYAAWAKDERIYKTSSSGGIATILSQYFLNNDDAVIAARFINKRLCHKLVTKETISAFQGSKYTQSDMNETYAMICNTLDHNQKVLFIGTPCQNAGVKSYFSTRLSDIYFVDLICHGVAPQSYLKEHLQTIAGKCNWSNVCFRKSDKYFLSVTGDSFKIGNDAADPYLIGFLKSLFFRENCYSCRYACPMRVADLTLGDFWGLDDSESPYSEGASVVLINSKKGKELFNAISKDIYYKERDYKEARLVNEQLNRPSLEHPRRSIFLENYPLYGFDIAVRKAIKKEIFICRIKKYIKMILGTKFTKKIKLMLYKT